MNRSTRSLGAALSFLIAPLALAQEHGPPSPPQEAIDACAGRETGASCTFQHDGRSVGGSCRAIPGGTLVACAPPHVQRGPPPEALEACQGQQDGATCQFTAPRGETIAGVCRSGPRGEPAACAPKDAPPPPATGGSEVYPSLAAATSSTNKRATSQLAFPQATAARSTRPAVTRGAPRTSPR